MKNNIEPKKSSFKLMIIGIVIIATLLFSFVFITKIERESPPLQPWDESES